MAKKWLVAAKKADFNQIARDCGITPVLARLIRNRDVEGSAATGKYLYGTLRDLHDPMLLHDMDAAAVLLNEKIRTGAKIRIIGDYDADGICSSTILWRMLTFLKGNADVRLPDRVRDGYGINERLVREAAADHVDTILTCDNGIAARQPLALADSLGMSVILTDHHEIPYEDNPDGTRRYLLPPALAIVEPKLVNERTGKTWYPFTEICGAEVAYKLAQVMLDYPDISGEPGETETDRQKLLRELLGFAAIATVCDVMPLADENRIVVRYGLREVERTRNTGLRALLLANGLGGKRITCYHAGFIIGPCLNASGRIDSAQRALDLFRETDEARAASEAALCKELNESRKTMTQKGVEEAERYVSGLDLAHTKVLVIQLNDCHESIAGIVAGRIREKYTRPTFVLTRTGEGIVKGSGRSVEGYDMYGEMNRVSTLFLKFGGHKMAAGLSMEEKNVDGFRRQLNANCPLDIEEMQDVLHIDMELPMRLMDVDFVQSLSLLEPCGNGNPGPLFVTRNLLLTNTGIYGSDRNVLKFRGTDGTGRSFDLVLFRKEEDAADLLSHPVHAHVVYEPGINEYRGSISLQFTIRDYRIL